MSADAAWLSLNAALQDYAPPCTGHASFTADSRSDAQQAGCASICARCPIADLCGAYAAASKVDTGFWAGVDRSIRGKPGPPRRNVTSTTDAEAVSSAPIERNTP